MTSFQEWEGYNDECCMDEFRGNLQKPVVSSNPNSYGWVFWYPKTESSYVSLPLKIQCFLEAVTPDLYTYTLECCMVQFWGMKDEGCLTTVDQPFAVVGDTLYKGYSWYRKLCESHQYSVKSAEGPVGRVYLNRYPESTPDLRLYSVKDFPLRNQAARCGFTKYLALPLFDLLNNECYGVLELVTRLVVHPLAQTFSCLDSGLENAGLKTSHFSCSSIEDSRYHKPEAEGDDDVAKMMELAIELVPQLQPMC